MPFNQSGQHASANFGTYNDIAGDQINHTGNHTNSEYLYNNISKGAKKTMNSVRDFLRGDGNAGNTVINYGGNTTNTSIDNSSRNNNDYSTHQTLNIGSPSVAALGDTSSLPSISGSDHASSGAPVRASPSSASANESRESPLTPLHSPDNIQHNVTPLVHPSDRPPNHVPLSPSPASNGEKEQTQLRTGLIESGGPEGALDYQLLELAHRVNDDIQEMVQRIVSWIRPDRLAFNLRKSVLALHPDRQNPLIAELISSKIQQDALGSSIILPSILCLFYATLLERVFEPFAPGLDDERSDDLLDMLDRITLSESPERVAIWRSVTYSHCRLRFDPRNYASRVAREFLAAVRDFIPMLLPPVVSMNLLNIFLEFENIVTATIMKAIELQDHLLTRNQPPTSQVYIVKSGIEFDPATADCYIPPVEVTSRNELSRSSKGVASSRRVLGCTKLGFGVMRSGGTEKGELEILSKAEVILN